MKILSKKMLGEGRWLVINELSYEAFDGKIRSWEMVSRQKSRGAVVMLARLIPGGEIILIRQYRPPVNKFVIEFPAGLIDDGENPVDAAIRELKEETGYTGEVRDCSLDVYSSPGMSDEALYLVQMDVFRCQQHNMETDFDDAENIETFTVSDSELETFLDSARARGDAVDAKVEAYAMHCRFMRQDAARMKTLPENSPVRKALRAIGAHESSLEMEFEPDQNDLAFDDETIRKHAEFCSLPPDAVEKMLEAAAVVRGNPDLQLLANTMFRSIYQSGSRWSGSMFNDIMGEELAGALKLIVAAGFVPAILRYHAEEGIPESITRATCSQINNYYRNYLAACGKIGLFHGQLSWTRYYLVRGYLYLRLGRFEFQTKKYNQGHRVFRSRKDGSLVIFAAPGIPIDSYGFGVAPEETHEFVTAQYLDQIGGTFTGYTVDRAGRTARGKSAIPLADYDCILADGMPVLDMHIPMGGGMTPAAAQESLKMAKEFYGSLPDVTRRPVAVMCTSWIFSPNLPEFLPESSNLVQLLRRVHPVPYPSERDAGVGFIFHYENGFDRTSCPVDTSLRRAAAEYLESGKYWRMGCMFLMMDEI